MNETYPNETNAGPHFTWNELIVSGSQPALAAKYRKMFPNGNWPMLSDPVLWEPGDSRIIDIRNRARPFILENPVSAVMADHINNLVEPLRKALGGRPRVVNSGWRPPELNKEVGGARLSGHMLGVATDILADSETRKLAREWAIERQRSVGDIGFFKTYTTFFHIGSVRGYSDGIIDGTRYNKR